MEVGVAHGRAHHQEALAGLRTGDAAEVGDLPLADAQVVFLEPDDVGQAVDPVDRAHEAPINAIPLSEVEPFLKDLRVVDEFDQPALRGRARRRPPAQRQGQVVYVRGLADAQPGQRFAVLRPTLRYTR